MCRSSRLPAVPQPGTRTRGRTTIAVQSNWQLWTTEKGNVDQPSVLIISDDAEFSRAVTARWQSERTVPAFTLMSSDVCLGLDPDIFRLAIAGSIRPQAVSVVLEAMEAAGKRVLFVSDDMRLVQTVRDRWPGIAIV